MGRGVSIVLVMKNERANLERSFDQIQGQDYDGPVEFVYVDSGSTDGTIDFMRERGVEAIAIPPEEFHHAVTRNLGARHATNEILVFLSGDAIPAGAQWLARLVAPFDDARVGAVYGRQTPPPGIGPLRAHALEHEYPPTGVVRDLEHEAHVHPGLFRFSNANSAVRRDVWERFPFDETVLLAEDQAMCYSVLTHGMKVVYEPAAAVEHGHERTLWEEFRFAFENGASLTRVGVLGNPDIGGEAGYGLRRVRDDLGFFLSKRRYGCALKCLAVNAVKWLGVQVGKRERRLPLWLTRRISPAVMQARR